MSIPFSPDQTYTKKKIYEILNVPVEKQGGEWHTGYRIYNEDIFIFCNIGIPGRTGHDYDNQWDGDLFLWEAKNRSKITHKQIQRMINPLPGQKNYLFTRTDDNDPFTFEGTVVVSSYNGNVTPVRIIWRLEHDEYESLDENEPSIVSEGAASKKYVNRYERNPLARRICIQQYGTNCSVCGFDFLSIYGELGRNYIHVHHLTPIASIGKEYHLDAKKDLIPLCPNCHAMIHKRQPAITIEELREIIKKQKSNKA